MHFHKPFFECRCMRLWCRWWRRETAFHSSFFSFLNTLDLKVLWSKFGFHASCRVFDCECAEMEGVSFTAITGTRPMCLIWGWHPPSCEGRIIHFYCLMMTSQVCHPIGADLMPSGGFPTRKIFRELTACVELGGMRLFNRNTEKNEKQISTRP